MTMGKRRRFSWKPWLIGLAALVAIASGAYGAHRSRVDARAWQAASEVDPVAEYRRAPDVDLGELAAEYRDNEVRADDRYKGRAVRLVGLVERVSVSLGSPSVTLSVEDERVSVRCLMIQDQPGVSRLSKGDRAALIGRVDGYMLGVRLSDCVLDQRGAP